MLYVDSYIAYFKDLCVRHPSLLHTDSEGGRVFSIIAPIDAVYGNFRTAIKEKNIAFMLLLYTSDVLRDGWRAHQGGFIVLKQHSLREEGDESLFEALSESEKIGWDFIEKMVHDSRDAANWWAGSIDDAGKLKLNVQPMLNEGDVGYSGYRFLFEFSNDFRNCLDHADSPEWLPPPEEE